MPSGQPSFNPSISVAPSSQPSEHPSVSGRPSSQPSDSPSASGRPSSMPSSVPSSQSSEAPSVSGMPSSQPSENPSISVAPSSQPSEHPSVSDWPTSQPSPRPSFPILPLNLVGDNNNPSDAFPLDRCQGDCDGDPDCQGDLVCFTWIGSYSVPGCSGHGLGRDYCTFRPYQTYLAYVGNTGFPASAYPLGLCEGDCDADSDCDQGLYCFKREVFAAVPGCDGKGSRGKDYCIYI